MAAALEASTVRCQTMADGTLRLVVDFEPAAAQAAFRAFGAPGTPVAAARLKTRAEQAQESAAEPDKPKGGPLAKLAGQWCTKPEFLSFVRPLYDRAMGGDGSSWGDVTPRDFGADAAGQIGYCRHAILVLCEISSRAELDHDTAAAQRFHTLIREPYAEHLKHHP